MTSDGRKCYFYYKMSDVVCPYCKSGLRGGSDVIRCVRCDTRHHWICWMEHGNHCSVFSCPGNLIKVRVKRQTNLFVFLWCLSNYAVHLGLRFAGVLGDSLNIPDAALVICIEAVILASGIKVLRSRIASESARSFGALLFSSNAFFLIFLFGYMAARGLHGLNALIRL